MTTPHTLLLSSASYSGNRAAAMMAISEVGVAGGVAYAYIGGPQQAK